MNYVELHIGDYERRTAHLTACEDGIYLRLLRLYYMEESALPNDVKALQRRVRAHSRDEKAAVVAVLEEFFTLDADANVWRQDRCDAEIERYREGDAERAERAANEKERMRRHREERSRLFEQLRERGITPKWDTTVTQLRDMVKRLCNAPETRTGDEQKRSCNAPETANQTPVTRHQIFKESTTCFQSESTDSAGAGPAPEESENQPQDPCGRRPAAGLPDCPHGRILELYAKHLPHLTQHRSWEGARREKLRCRWQQAAKPSTYSPEGYATEAGGLQWWDSFLSYIATDTRLSGGFERDDGSVWRPDLDWICTAGNFQKIIDGKYDK